MEAWSLGQIRKQTSLPAASQLGYLREGTSDGVFSSALSEESFGYSMPASEMARWDIRSRDLLALSALKLS
jgi:hypothetical protein